jgi:ribosome-binding protein aMBF1 (putative translation factor)
MRGTTWLLLPCASCCVIRLRARAGSSAMRRTVRRRPAYAERREVDGRLSCHIGQQPSDPIGRTPHGRSPRSRSTPQVATRTGFVFMPESRPDEPVGHRLIAPSRNRCATVTATVPFIKIDKFSRMSPRKSNRSPVGTPATKARSRRARRSAEYRAAQQDLVPYESIARFVIQRRAELAMTQEQLAERMGTSHSAISRIESGQHRTSVATLQRLAEALDVRFVMGFERGPADRPVRDLVEGITRGRPNRTRTH